MDSRLKTLRIAVIAAIAVLMVYRLGAELAPAPPKPAPQRASIQLAQAPAKPVPRAAPAKPAGGAATTGAATAEQMRKADEKTIRANVEEMIKAFDAKDVDAVVRMFTPDAEIVDEDGNVSQGRAEIKQIFAAAFEKHPESKLKVSIESLRFVSPSVVVEEGTSTVQREKGAAAANSRYTVVHVKQEGKWLTALVRDFPDDEADAAEDLRNLGWLVGDWVEEGEDSLTRTTYRWDEHKRYLLGDFSLQVAGRISLSGLIRIGWDPQAKKLRSWVFDSKGGFVEGLWTRDGNRWISKMAGVTSEGRTASATNVTTRVNKNQMTWESHDRIVDDEVTPDIEKIVIVRKPPPLE